MHVLSFYYYFISLSNHIHKHVYVHPHAMLADDQTPLLQVTVEGSTPDVLAKPDAHVNVLVEPDVKPDPVFTVFAIAWGSASQGAATIQIEWHIS